MFIKRSVFGLLLMSACGVMATPIELLSTHLPQSYTIAVTGNPDTKEEPSLLEVFVDGAVITTAVTHAGANVIIQRKSVTKTALSALPMSYTTEGCLTGLTKSKVYGLLTRLKNMMDNNLDAGKATQGLANLYSKTNETQQQIAAIRCIINGYQEK